MSINSVDILDNDGRDPILEAARGIRYGPEEVVVHGGHVIQIERRVKVGGTEPLGTREEKE